MIKMKSFSSDLEQSWLLRRRVKVTESFLLRVIQIPAAIVNWSREMSKYANTLQKSLANRFRLCFGGNSYEHKGQDFSTFWVTEKFWAKSRCTCFAGPILTVVEASHLLRLKENKDLQVKLCE